MRTKAISSSYLRHLAWLLAAALVVSGTACTSGSDEGSEAEPQSTNTSGSAPDDVEPGDPPPMTLSGTPVDTVAAGAEFRFRPQLGGAAAENVTFTVTNLPDWASFDAATGEMAGRPQESDVGSWNDVVISASDGERTASLDAFSVEVVATPLGSAQLSWTAPTENADGSPLTDLAGFRVYWGAAEDELSYSVQIDNPSISMYLVENLTPSQWFFAVTAIDAGGNESALSEVISGLIS